VKERPRFTHRVSAPIRNLAQRFAYLGLIGAAFALLLLGKADLLLIERMRAQVADAFAPILDVMSRPIATANEVIAKGREMAAVREENASLRAANSLLMEWQASARQMEAENRALRDQLKFVPGPQASFITARVIADAGGAFAHSLLLNIGAQPGVSKGQAVIAGNGLVGRVESIGTRATRVLLINDINSRIPVLIEATRTRAIMAGDNTDRPRLIHLPSGATASPGDRIVTSGHGGAFPPGLPVGVVVQVGDGGIAVQPFVKRDRIEYVRVVDYGLKGILAEPLGETGGGAQAK